MSEKRIEIIYEEDYNHSFLRTIGKIPESRLPEVQAFVKQIEKESKIAELKMQLQELGIEVLKD